MAERAACRGLRGRRQPRSLCPPSSSSSCAIRGGKGTKAENNCYCFSRLSTGRCCCPATLAVARWPRCARSCADAGRDTVPIHRLLSPSPRSLVPTSTDRRSQHPQQGYPRHCSSCPTAQHHWVPPRCSGHPASRNPLRLNTCGREEVSSAHGTKQEGRRKLKQTVPGNLACPPLHWCCTALESRPCWQRDHA